MAVQSDLKEFVGIGCDDSGSGSDKKQKVNIAADRPKSPKHPRKTPDRPLKNAKEQLASKPKQLGKKRTYAEIDAKSKIEDKKTPKNQLKNKNT